MDLNNCNYIKYARVYFLDDAIISAKIYSSIKKVYARKCVFGLVLFLAKLSKYLCFGGTNIKLKHLIIRRLRINVNMRTAFEKKRTI